MPEKTVPDRLYVKKGYKKDFDELREKLNLHAKNVFFMAMALGFLNSSPEEDLESKEEFVLGIEIEESDESLISAIAIHEVNNVGVLLDKEKVYSIAERYASGGLKYLKQDVTKEQFGSYMTLLEEQLLEQYGRIT
jgi:hypothetical protein